MSGAPPTLPRHALTFATADFGVNAIVLPSIVQVPVSLAAHVVPLTHAREPERSKRQGARTCRRRAKVIVSVPRRQAPIWLAGLAAGASAGVPWALLITALRDCPGQDAGFSPLTFAWGAQGLPLRRVAAAQGWRDEDIAALEQFRDDPVSRAISEAQPSESTEAIRTVAGGRRPSPRQ